MLVLAVCTELTVAAKPVLGSATVVSKEVNLFANEFTPVAVLTVCVVSESKAVEVAAPAILVSPVKTH